VEPCHAQVELLCLARGRSIRPHYPQKLEAGSALRPTANGPHRTGCWAQANEAGREWSGSWESSTLRHAACPYAANVATTRKRSPGRTTAGRRMAEKAIVRWTPNRGGTRHCANHVTSAEPMSVARRLTRQREGARPARRAALAGPNSRSAGEHLLNRFRTARVRLSSIVGRARPAALPWTGWCQASGRDSVTNGRGT
jgi:hypothetical protein